MQVFKLSLIKRVYVFNKIYCSATVAVTCEKDVGMGLCMLHLCYPYTLLSCFLALHPYVYLNFFEFFSFSCFILVTIKLLRNATVEVATLSLGLPM